MQTFRGRLRAGAAADLVIASAALEHDLGALDVDVPGTHLTVIARGHRVPDVSASGRIARIAAAYVEGTALTLGRTLQSWARERIAARHSRRPRGDRPRP